MIVHYQAADQFIAQLDIRHGPEELLAHFFFKAVNAAAERGVFLEFGTFADLLDINRRNSDSWFPITTSFRPEPGGACDDNGFVILGRDATGEVVATQAERLYDWRGTNLKREAEELRLFYSDPIRQKRASERCIVVAPEAAEVSGLVAYSGGVWYRPDYRRKQLTEIIPRLGRAYAYGLWGFDSLAALITPQNIKKTFDRRTGYRKVSNEAVILRNSPSLPDGDLHMTLARQTPSDLIDDTFAFLMDFGAQVDRPIRDRRAQ